MVVKVKIVVITWQCIDFPVLLMSMLSRTPAMSFITHSFGSDAPTARPSSWLSQVTRTREKHKSGSDELPWRYRTFFVFEFASFTPRRVGSIRDKFAMFPTLSWMKATIRFKYLCSKKLYQLSNQKRKKKKRPTLHWVIGSEAGLLKIGTCHCWNTLMCYWRPDRWTQHTQNTHINKTFVRCFAMTGDQ